MRREIIDAGVKIHAEQVEKDEAGEKSMFMTRKEAREEKKKRGGTNKEIGTKRRKGTKRRRKWRLS